MARNALALIILTSVCGQLMAEDKATTIAEVASGDYVCSEEGVGLGYVIESIIENEGLHSVCKTGKAYGLKSLMQQSSINVCAGSPVPSGWVVTAIQQSVPACGGYSGFTITNTAGLSSIRACNRTVIPDGWVVTATYQSQLACNSEPAFDLVSVNPPPPPPPPPMPQAPQMYPAEKINATSHIVKWRSASDVSVGWRYALERSVNYGGWKIIKKGEASAGVSDYYEGNASPGVVYKYRAYRITESGISPRSSEVLIQQ